MAKGGGGCFRPSYGLAKFTLFSKNITTKMSRYKKLDYEPTLIRFGSDILKIVAVLVFFDGSF